MSVTGTSKPASTRQVGLVMLAAVVFAAGSIPAFLWIVRHTSEIPAVHRRILWLAFAVLALLIQVALGVLSFRWMVRRARHEHASVRQALQHAVGAAPAMEPAPPGISGGNLARKFLLVFAVGVGAFFALRAIWPQAPAWTLVLVLLVFWELFQAGKQSLKKREQLPAEPIGWGAPPRYDWKKTAAALLSALAFLALLNMNWIVRYFQLKGWGPGILPLALMVLVALTYGAYELGRGLWVERTLKRGEYDKALRLTEKLARWPGSGLLRLSRGLILFYAGRQKEAEEALRAIVEQDQSPAGKALALRRLGHVLMAQARYEEAARVFESAVKILPQNAAASHSGLAEIRLRQGIKPAEALALAGRALEAQRTSLLARKTARERFGEIRGNQAWALALLGRVSEAAEAIAAGLRETDLGHQPELAAFHWRCGMAMAVAGSLTAANAHFRRAREIDSEGYYGGLAAGQLRQHSVWGAVGSSRHG